ncbi:zinc finger BED domain-containing protein RICESLEEPER 1-like [Vitis riparia]|uniref:zinc finger BED domain-containing protein RICESLEEPER 1-like n=1 Tax=Vitis riparia TaxID=96939 RepID=UPI00155AD6F2|nr:zinc finger BED domain-containing protein RICESLEEPER 1-like [Vitis riparia]
MEISESVIVRSSRLKSVVWNDFDRVKKCDTCVAICRHCKKKLSGSSTSGTSHLRNHLIRCRRRSNHDVAQLFASREKKKEGAVTLSNYAFDEDQKKDEVLNVVNIKFEQDQVKDGISNIGNNVIDQKRSRFDLARMIILHGYPLTMVEHLGFKIFVKNLQPLFDLVSLNGVEANCMEIYEKEKQKMYEVLDKLSGKISLGADMWNASGDVQYLCLTSQYIDESWELQKKILNFVIMDPSHTEDMLSEVIMTCLMDWDIDHALEALSEVTCKIRESIRYVKSSQAVQEKFNEMAQQARVESQKFLCLDNPLRWNLTYFMLVAALEYKDAFSLLQEHDSAYTMCPSDTEWERAGAIAGYLKLFIEVTHVFSGSKYPTANIYFPEICDIHLQLIDLCNSSDILISTLALKMKNKFDEYWKQCSLALAVAAILDPRFKMKLVEYYYSKIYGSNATVHIDDISVSIKALFNEHAICSPLASLDHHEEYSIFTIVYIITNEHCC